MREELQEFGVTLNSRPACRSALVGFCWQPEIQVVYSAATLTDALDLSGNTAEWVIDTAKKLEALGRLQTGWDSYGGLPLQGRAKSLTLQVLEWLRRDELPVPAVVLGSAGTVQMEWRAKGRELEVELRDDNTVEYVMVSSNGDIDEGKAELDLSAKLRDLTGWLLSGTQSEGSE